MGQRGPWCGRSGMINGKTVGLAVFDYETNPRYPTNWHGRDYGLMTVNGLGWRHHRPQDKVKGEMTLLRRIVTHRDGVSKGKVKDGFVDYIAPPRVIVK